MSEVVGSIWWLIVALGLLVTFHEFGHYWVARRLGVKVLRFSVGFGKSLWSRRAADGTEYVVAALPLGGYVKMLDEREGDVAPADLDGAFNRKPVLSRMAIVAAGPVFNLVFALLAFWLMFLVGKPDFLPVVGRVDGIAQASGFERGDRIVAIAGDTIATWTDASMLLARHAIDREPVAVVVTTASGAERTRTLKLQDLVPSDDPASPPQMGLFPQQFLLAPVVSSFDTDSPAEKAGMRAGDLIVAVGAQSITSFDELPAAIQREGADGAVVRIAVERGTDRLQIDVRPARRESDGRLLIGVRPQVTTAEYDTVRQFGPVDALGASAQESWRMTREMLALLKRMIVGTASLKNISGPISIAQYANTSAQLGVAWFLFFLGVMSLSLAVMNLLPIPILDGGHLLYYLIELVKGSPVSERVVAAGQYVGLGLLALLMGLAFYNDILRLVSS